MPGLEERRTREQSLCRPSGEPVLGSRGLPSKSKPNPKPGVLRRHDAPKQHFLYQYQGWGQGKKPPRVSSAQGHPQTALRMRSALATCQSPSAHCPFLTGSCPHRGSGQTRVLPRSSPPCQGMGVTRQRPVCRVLSQPTTIVKADSPACETTRGQGKVSSAEPPGPGSPPKSCALPAPVAQLPSVTSSNLKKGLEGPIQRGSCRQSRHYAQISPCESGP